jgi:hypothetical protein
MNGKQKLLEYADMADMLGGGRIRIDALGGVYTSAELRECAAAIPDQRPVSEDT